VPRREHEERRLLVDLLEHCERGVRAPSRSRGSIEARVVRLEDVEDEPVPLGEIAPRRPLSKRNVFGAKGGAERPTLIRYSPCQNKSA
jgi:hypothetical protein